jgi:hypothetical protein
MTLSLPCVVCRTRGNGYPINCFYLSISEPKVGPFPTRAMSIPRCFADMFSVGSTFPACAKPVDRDRGVERGGRHLGEEGELSFFNPRVVRGLIEGGMYEKFT